MEQKAKMQPLPREVCDKINEYKRAVTNKAKMAILRNDYIPSCLVRCSKPHSLPRTLSTYALPSFSHIVAHGQLSQKRATPILTVISTCQYKGHCHEICVRHTLQIHTPNLHQVRMH